MRPEDTSEFKLNLIRDALQDVTTGSRNLFGICIALTSLVFTAMFHNLASQQGNMRGIFPHLWSEESRALWSAQMVFIFAGVTFAYAVFIPIYISAQQHYRKQEALLQNHAKKLCQLRDNDTVFDLLNKTRLKPTFIWGPVIFLVASWLILIIA